MASTYDLNAFINTKPGIDQPDAQLLFWNLTFDKSSFDVVKPEDEPGMLAMGYPLRTSSEGRLTLRSANPDDGPALTTKFLATDHDRETMIGLSRYVRRLFSHPKVAPFIEAETYPGFDGQDDEQILDAATCLPDA